MKPFLLVLAILLTPVLVAADTVELRTGQRVDGAFKGADEASVRIATPEGLRTFRPEQVRAIYYGSVPGTIAPGTSRTEALHALQALQATTVVHPSYAEYLGRVAYAKGRLSLLMPKATDTVLDRTIWAAMDFYSGAGDMWAATINAKIDGPDSMIRKERAVQDIRTAIHRAPGDCDGLARLQSSPDADLFTSAVPAAWSCGSDRIAAVEKILAGE